MTPEAKRILFKKKVTPAEGERHFEENRRVSDPKLGCKKEKPLCKIKENNKEPLAQKERKRRSANGTPL